MDALITEAKNGDKEAFVRLIRMNKQSLYKTAWIYLRDEQDIADAQMCIRDRNWTDSFILWAEIMADGQMQECQIKSMKC